MKKLLLFLFLIIGTQSWAACPDNIAPTELAAGTAAVKTSSGSVCSVTYTFNGVAAGASIQLKDSLTDSGTVRLTLTAGATAGSIIKEYPYGAYYGTGIFYKENDHTGTVKTYIQYF